MRLSPKYLFALLLSLPIITNCSEVSTKDITARLESKLLSNYNLLRWNNFQQIKSTQTEKYKNAEIDYVFLKKIKVNQVHQTNLFLSNENRRADVYYALEFYDTDTNKVQAINYHQEWIIEEEHQRTWILNSPLPDFKAALQSAKPKIKVIKY